MSASPSLSVAVGVQVKRADLFSSTVRMGCRKGHPTPDTPFCPICGVRIGKYDHEEPTPLYRAITERLGESKYNHLGIVEYEESGLDLTPLGHDFDNDGHSDLAEYLAMTNPLSPASFFKVTQVNPLTPGGTTTALTWTSSRTRLYRIETSVDLGQTDNWEKSPLDPVTFTPDEGATTTRNTQNPAADKRFFRVQSIIPLQP
jgi:hypothetical protein